jgi:trehalose-6-phosphate synthase
MPIHFMHKSVAFDELIALYAVSDVCLVSSTRDGMNLVSYEYIATQQKRHGVMILSEFTGAAQSLNGSIVVNPWNTEELANAINEAITLPADLRKVNHEKLYAYVTKYTRYAIGVARQCEFVLINGWQCILGTVVRRAIDVHCRSGKEAGGY